MRKKLGVAGLLLVGAALALVHYACDTERPGIVDEKYAKPLMKHEGHTDACASCHEEDRKQEADGSAHGGGKDCVACHKPSDVNAGWLPASPFTHNPAPATCLPCHSVNRPKPPHVQEGDCHSCHRFPSWTPI